MTERPRHPQRRSAQAAQRTVLLALAIAALPWVLLREEPVGSPRTVLPELAAEPVSPSPPRPCSRDSGRTGASVSTESEDHELVDAFVADGWHVAHSPAPDARVVALDPDALDEQERQIRLQLATTSVAGEKLGNVSDLAARATDEETRTAAIESLGRSRDPYAQELLVGLYERLPDEETRSLILTRLHPASFDDAAAQLLLAEIDRREAPAAVGEQAAYPLLAMAALGGQSAFDARVGELAERLSPHGQAALARAYEALRHGRPGHHGAS